MSSRFDPIKNMLERTVTDRARASLEYLTDRDSSLAHLIMYTSFKDGDPKMLGRMKDTHVEEGDDEEITGPIACATSDTIYLFPDFEKLDFSNRNGVTLHELLHVILQHSVRGILLQHKIGPNYEHHLHNAMCDAIINDVGSDSENNGLFDYNFKAPVQAGPKNNDPVKYAVSVMMGKNQDKEEEVTLSFPDFGIFLSPMVKAEKILITDKLGRTMNDKIDMRAMTSEELYFHALAMREPLSEYIERRAANISLLDAIKKHNKRLGKRQLSGLVPKAQEIEAMPRQKGKFKPLDVFYLEEELMPLAPIINPEQYSMGDIATLSESGELDNGADGDDAGGATLSQADIEAITENLRDWERKVAAAAQGSKPLGVLRKISHDLTTTNTNWRRLLRCKVHQSASKKRKYNTQRPSRSWISLNAMGYKDLPLKPGMVRQNKVPRACFAVDTSGSMTEEALMMALNEMYSIQKMVGCDLEIITCDAKVHTLAHVKAGRKADIHNVELKGGGGTSFIPVFKHFEETRRPPDILIYLTDMMGSFPEKAPPYPVVWADVSYLIGYADREGFPPPFGLHAVLDRN